MPVNGSVPPCALDDDDVPLESVEVEAPLESVEDDCDGEELLVEDEEPVELELELELELDEELELLEPDPEDEDPLDCGVLLVPVSGSTYC
jgi:hypothetical protein